MAKELILQQKLYDFTLYISERTAKFPRTYRFSYGNRIELLLMDTLSLVMRQNRMKKLDYLEKIDLNLEELKILLRLSKDLRLLPVKSYEFAMKNLLEIGKIFGGWRKRLTGAG